MADCVIDKKNLGISKCNALPALMKGMITTPANFSITTTNALVKANWQNALLATESSRIYLWPKFRMFENASEDAVYEETDLSSQKVRDGRYRFKVSVQESLCLHKAMFTHSGNASQKVFFIDTENQIIGTLNAAGNFCGFDIELLNVEKLKFNDGKVSTKTPIYVVLSDNKELDVNGAIIGASAFVNDLFSIVDVDIVQTGSATTSLIKVTVKATCDGTSIDGLVAADFTVKSSSGTSRTISGVTQASDGVYSIASSAAFTVGDIVDLVAASALSIPGYESTGGKVTV
jgi:hypothetical protein